MLEESGGCFVVNVRDAKWVESPDFGLRASFEIEGPFPQTGVRLAVLQRGQPNCRYHRENAQEDFLVLSGECLLLVNGEERPLRAWDFVHCPPGVSHVFVGAGEEPCALLAIGHRPTDQELFYPHADVAERHGAQSPEPTPDPRVAYRDVHRPTEVASPDWPIG